MTPTDQLFAHRYRLEGRLGAGGMSTVQLAFDTRLERYVAVKLLAEHLAEDSNFVARFRREALAAARLVHPNVVQVYDFGSDDASGRQFIVMEYVKGPSCAELLRDRGRLPADEAVEIVAQACRGLDYAHRNGVVHRDVKPGNLLRNPDGVIKLADFGIAKAAEDSDITRVGSVLGTAAYLSPEQAHGEPAGPTSDLYALGVVAYQLMAGRLPYDAGSLTELARQQELGGPPALSDIDPAIPPAVSVAVARALERDPLARYASAAEMESALRDAQRGIAPAPAEEATRALGNDTAATRMLARDRTGTGAAVRSEAPPRRRLEPLPDSEAPPRRRPAPLAEPATPAPRARRRKANWARRCAALLMVGLLAALGILGYQLIAESTQRGVQLKETVEGDLRQTIDEIRDLIRDNTR